MHLLAAYAAPVVKGAHAHAFYLQERIHLRMALELFATAVFETCCVWSVRQEVGLFHVGPYLVRPHRTIRG